MTSFRYVPYVACVGLKPSLSGCVIVVDLCGVINELVPVDGSPTVVLQVVEQRAAVHQLRDDQKRLALRADGVQSYQLRVVKSFHDRRLFEELRRLHRTRLERLHRDLGAPVPHACSDTNYTRDVTDER